MILSSFHIMTVNFKTMKRHTIIFLLILFYLCGPRLSAQTHYDSNIALGVKGGVEFSRVNMYPSVPQSFLAGATAGFMFRYCEENHFGIVAELNFMQHGWKESFDGLPFEYSRTLNYIELPVMAHIYFGRRGRFFLNAGPQIGLRLGDSSKSNFDHYNIDKIKDFPVRNRQNGQQTLEVSQRIDYGICAGIGSEFFLNPKNSINFEVRFYYGLGNIFPSKRADLFSASNNMSLSATLGYFFRIK